MRGAKARTQREMHVYKNVGWGHWEAQGHAERQGSVREVVRVHAMHAARQKQRPRSE